MAHPDLSLRPTPPVAPEHGGTAGAERWVTDELARQVRLQMFEDKPCFGIRAYEAGRRAGITQGAAAGPVDRAALVAELEAAARDDDEPTLRARLERLAAQLRGGR